MTASLLWKPLLAPSLPVDADLDALPYPLWGSPKLDGFRCMGQRGTAVTRKGLRYRNTAVRALFERSGGAYDGLDGELCVGPPWAADVFNRTQNCVNTSGEAAAEEFRRHGFYHVFAKWSPVPWRSPASMFEEMRFLRGLPKLRIVPQVKLRNAKQLADYETRQLAKGYEGVMLIRADRVGYPQKEGKENRSTLREFYLVKLKRFEYDFAKIVAVHPLEHNLNEERTAAGKRSTKRDGIVVDATRIGSVTVRDKRGREFNITVSTNELREKGPSWWWARRGTEIRYKYQAVGTKDKPRILTATFKELL